MDARANNLAAHAAKFANCHRFFDRCRTFLGSLPRLEILRYVHRLDAETTGVLLFGKTPGAVRSYGELFESRDMEKRYLAIIEGAPPRSEWACRESIGEQSSSPKRMRIDPRHGKPAETHFKVLAQNAGRFLIEARPITGRTHQIRVHLAHTAAPVLGDALYGKAKRDEPAGTALDPARLSRPVYTAANCRKGPSRRVPQNV
jgi:RluA family pseudouridine synthase